jgi:hypothetical protein
MRRSLLLVGLIILTIGAVLIPISQYATEKEDMVYSASDFSTGSSVSFDWRFGANTKYRVELTGETYDAGLLGQAIYMRVHTSTVGVIDLGLQQKSSGPYSWTYEPRSGELVGNIVLEDQSGRPIILGTTLHGTQIPEGFVYVNIYAVAAGQSYVYLFYVGISLAVIGAGVIAVGGLHPSHPSSNLSAKKQN